MTTIPGFTRTITPPTTTTTKTRHLETGLGTVGDFGSWYTICGRIQTGWRSDDIDVEDGEMICGRCHSIATKRAARRAR